HRLAPSAGGEPGDESLACRANERSERLTERMGCDAHAVPELAREIARRARHRAVFEDRLRGEPKRLERSHRWSAAFRFIEDPAEARDPVGHQRPRLVDHRATTEIG